ncbi:MAG TPA: imidazole glycerol phosphate synthase subunit HisF [Elusimicrobiota bacterium]|nr:imidazole glycerol phosphate synthase subunit HisF [Elusimicrobiota bacterium]
MLAKRIIPCLDVDAGRVVKGTRFLNLKDAGDPVELAKRYDAEGADELVFLDITASAQKRPILLEVVCRTAEQVFIPLTVGGGIRTVDDIRTLLKAGADKVSLNTVAVQFPRTITDGAVRFGTQCIVVAIDAKQRADGGSNVYIYGGRQDTGLDAIAWAMEAERLGAGEILLTSMDRDGTQQGYDNQLLASMHRAVGVPIIASGGAGGKDDFVDAFTKGHADAALAASLFHRRQLGIGEVKHYLHKKGIPVRITS